MSREGSESNVGAETTGRVILDSALRVCSASLVALAVVWGAMAALNAARVTGAPTGVDAAAFMTKILSLNSSRDNPSSDVRLVLLGDSTAYHRKHENSGAGRLEASLRATRRRQPYRVLPVVMFGLDAFAYYALIDAVVEAEPEAVVIALNLATFRESRLEIERRPELAGWIGIDRWVEALRLPLHIVGLSPDRMLLYKAIVVLDLEQQWRRVRSAQSAAVKGLDRIRESLSARFFTDGYRSLGARRWDVKVRETAIPEAGNRHNAFGAREAFGPLLEGLETDNAVLRVLNATLMRLASAGVPTLVYSVPMNVEHLSRVGIDLERGLPASIELIEQVVEATGARFVDLHTLLPDSDFRDGIHFNLNEEPNGVARVGVELAEQVRPLLPTASSKPGLDHRRRPRGVR